MRMSISLWFQGREVTKFFSLAYLKDEKKWYLSVIICISSPLSEVQHVFVFDIHLNFCELPIHVFCLFLNMLLVFWLSCNNILFMGNKEFNECYGAFASSDQETNILILLNKKSACFKNPALSFFFFLIEDIIFQAAFEKLNLIFNEV